MATTAQDSGFTVSASMLLIISRHKHYLLRQLLAARSLTIHCLYLIPGSRAGTDKLFYPSSSVYLRSFSKESASGVNQAS